MAKTYNCQHLQVPLGHTDQCPALHQSVHRDLHRGGKEECKDHAQSAESAAQSHIYSGDAGHDDCGSAGGAGIRSACSSCSRRRWWKSAGRRWRHTSGRHTPVSCPSHSSCNSGWSGETDFIFDWCSLGVGSFWQTDNLFSLFTNQRQPNLLG